MATTPDPTSTDDVVRLGVSACLLGERVRFDGGHKRDAFLADTLGRFAEWVPVCPEEEAGFGTPREPMRLVQEEGDIRLLTVRTRHDVTQQLRKASKARATALVDMQLDGYILKKDSPSCGLMRVKVYTPEGPGTRTGRGLFADALCTALPLLPVEEEGRLCDPRLRENFIERVFAYRRLRALLTGRVGAGSLVRFHTRHKLLLLAHSPKKYSELGRLVASASGAGVTRLATEYGGAFMEALAVLPSRGRHSNVLRHMAGYFRTLVEADARRDVAASIDDYERGLVPLIVPITLLTHYARRHEVAYLLDQVYLQPPPKELMLRNHA
jgi:uncharacterized protein YbgA (DUF1722 family)/uncharacterized protein YbbK (DUF523 family)